MCRHPAIDKSRILEIPELLSAKIILVPSKMPNSFGTIKFLLSSILQYCDSNIRFFSNAPSKAIAFKGEEGRQLLLSQSLIVERAILGKLTV